MTLAFMSGELRAIEALYMHAGHSFAPQADHPDTLASVELLADRTLCEVSLRLHKACGWAAKLCRNTHDRPSSVARAVVGAGRCRDGANEDEGGEHIPASFVKALGDGQYIAVVQYMAMQFKYRSVFPAAMS
ncbi:hypothetical protein ACFFWD_37655 [Bradyrhizobium erythrophlei]|uniref:hypothetical protein n=1 Tax=Bradyrhizobium erythrophlei TaxID=1437360 RepID=UPI0035E67693